MRYWGDVRRYVRRASIFGGRGPSSAFLEDGGLQEKTMQAHDPALNRRTGFALFDEKGRLVGHHARIFGGHAPADDTFGTDLAAFAARVLPYFASFDGHPV